MQIKRKGSEQLFQAFFLAQSRKEQKHRRAGEKGRGKGNFNRKTTLHSEGKMHKAQKDEGRDTLMLMLTLRRQTTQKGVNQGETEKRS